MWLSKCALTLEPEGKIFEGTYLFKQAKSDNRIGNARVSNVITHFPSIRKFSVHDRKCNGHELLPRINVHGP